jgi:hypothetical protein
MQSDWWRCLFIEATHAKRAFRRLDDDEKLETFPATAGFYLESRKHITGQAHRPSAEVCD